MKEKDERDKGKGKKGKKHKVKKASKKEYLPFFIPLLCDLSSVILTYALPRRTSKVTLSSLGIEKL